jgi:arabinofuranosyltransferase
VSGQRGRLLPLFLSLCVPWLLLVDRFWYVCDDAFITFRYALNWAGGEGLRYNLWDAPPVEGYSNFLWTALCAGLFRLGQEPLAWTPLLGVACGAALLWRVLRALREDLGLSAAAAAAGAGSLALSPSFGLWSTSGLETMAYALASWLAFEQLFLRPAEGRAGARAGALGGAALLAVGLLRVEGFAWAGLMGAIALVAAALGARARRPAALRALLPGLAAAGGLFAAYYAWRWSYFGQPFANTVTAKVGFSGPVAARGLKYAAGFFVNTLGPLTAFAGVPAALRRPAVGLPLLLLAGAGLVWPVLVGGDFMPMGRLYVVALPFAALLVGLAVEQAGGRRALAAGLALGLSALGGAGAWRLNPLPEWLREPLHFRPFVGQTVTELDMWGGESKQVALLTQIGRALREHSAPGESLVSDAIGAIGYYSGLNIYDRYGLVTPSVAAREIEPGALLGPGHDKHVGPLFFVDQGPTYLHAQLLADPLESRVFAQDLHAWGVAERYAPEVIPLGELVAGNGERFLMRFRRIGEEEDPGWAWERWRRVMRAVEVERGLRESE